MSLSLAERALTSQPFPAKPGRGGFHGFPRPSPIISALSG